jgi:hypothetical protein
LEQSINRQRTNDVDQIVEGVFSRLVPMLQTVQMGGVQDPASQASVHIDVEELSFQYDSFVWQRDSQVSRPVPENWEYPTR